MTFRLDRHAGRDHLVAPGGEPFLSIGVVHANDTNLRYAHNEAVFAERYGGSRPRWLREGLAVEMERWGFNTIGWTSEYVSGSGLGAHGSAVDLGHGDELPADDLAATGLPYTLSLRVAETEAWNGHPAFRDPRGPAYAEWCDHLARTTCRPSDRNLLGYFLVDGPVWGPHPAGGCFAAGELGEIAAAYYETATAAIRRHDPNHLILGDRYGTKAGAPPEVLDAAAAHVDVLSVQTFPGVGAEAVEWALVRIGDWQQRTGLPVLVADVGNWCPTEMSPDRTGSARGQAERGENYAELAAAFVAQDWCLGWHWCSWVENPQRGFGLKDPWDEPYADLVDRAAAANRDALRAFRGSTSRDSNGQENA